jgi:hypothetical protein
MGEKIAFFSVKVPRRIDGDVYRSAMCYPVIGTAMERIVADLIAKGEARGFAEEVRFINGVPYPIKKPAAPAPAETRVQGKKLTIPSSASRKGK